MINVHLFLDKHIWCYHVLMKTNKYKISPVQYGIIAIIGFVIALSAVFIYIQASYSGKLKSIEVVVSNGPVSPESQQTQAVLISKDSCTFTTTKTLTNQSSSEPCVVQPGKFTQIQKDVAMVISQPEFRQTMLSMGMPPDAQITKKFDGWIDLEVARLKQIISRSKLQID